MVLEMTYPQLERAVNPTHDIKLFAGRSNPALAQEIADYLGTTVGPMVIKNFADGEIYVQVKESIRGDDVFIIQPLCNPVNENLMELLIMIDAFKRASAKSITAVIDFALALLKASIIINNSIRFSFTGLQRGWMMKTSSPRILSFT